MVVRRFPQPAGDIFLSTERLVSRLPWEDGGDIGDPHGLPLFATFLIFFYFHTPHDPSLI